MQKVTFVPNWYNEVFVITKSKNAVLWTYNTNDLKVEEIVGTFYKKKFQKTNQKAFRIQKINKRKSDKPCVKRKSFDLKVGMIKKILLYKNELFSAL